MNEPIWIGWVVIVLLAVISIVLLLGKGSFLIAGFNAASDKEKSKYNVKRLCHIVGGGTSLITIMLVVSLLYNGKLPIYLKWIMPWGYLMAIVVMLVLTNTICKKK
ncbi:MAG: DUF3784 domain-containing protein [Ruminiclostridium sp.]|nr:DUF3784 domain-containing protein [Ruminiclostridium sp.]